MDQQPDDDSQTPDHDPVEGPSEDTDKGPHPSLIQDAVLAAYDMGIRDEQAIIEMLSNAAVEITAAGLRELLEEFKKQLERRRTQIAPVLNHS